VKCGTVNIDSYIAEEGVTTVDIIKLDIEGAEGLAVNGMEKTIAKARPIFICEVHPHELSKFDSSVKEFLSKFDYHGYRIGVLRDH